MIDGAYEEQYATLFDYAEEIKASNKGSTVEIISETYRNGVLCFKRIYICYAGCKDAFNEGCRPVVGLDRCHLKGVHRDQLLTAMEVDSNNSLFPIAFAVIEAEKKSSWSWFLDILRVDIKISNGHHWVFITDKQKGLEQALKGLWEERETQAEHRHCARHLQSNFTKVFKGEFLKQKMMVTAKAVIVTKFDTIMVEIKQEDEEAYKWLITKQPIHWSRAFFRTFPQCDILLNNLCECSNGTDAILIARGMPILSMLERIRLYILKRFSKQRLLVNQWHGDIGPRIVGILEKNARLNSNFYNEWCGDEQYQVFAMYADPNKKMVGVASNVFAVDLKDMTCFCRKWDLTRIPCPHAISCIWSKNEDLVSYVSKWYRKETCVKIYAHKIFPIRARDAWPLSGKVPMKTPKDKR